MVTRRRKKIPLPLLDSPSGGSSAGRATGSPSPTPSQPRRQACTGEPGTDLGPQVSPTSGDQGQGRGFPFTPPHPPTVAQSPGITCQSFRPGWGQRDSHSPSPFRTCPASSGLRPARRGQARGRGTVPTWSPLTPCGHGSGSRSRSGEGRGGTRPGVGRKISPKRTPAHTRPPSAVGRRLAARGRRPQDTWPPAGRSAAGWRGRCDRGDRPLGAATLTARGPRWAGPASPASPASPAPAGPTLSSGRWGRAARSAAAPGGAFVPERGGACGKGLRPPLPRLGFLI